MGDPNAPQDECPIDVPLWKWNRKRWEQMSLTDRVACVRERARDICSRYHEDMGGGPRIGPYQEDDGGELVADALTLITILKRRLRVAEQALHEAGAAEPILEASRRK